MYYPQRVKPRRYRSTIPGSIPVLDRSNPLTAALQFCWVSAGGLQLNLVDGVRSGVNLAGTTTLLSSRPGRFGCETNLNAVQGIEFGSGAYQGINTSADYTIAALGKPNSTTPTNATGDTIYSQRNTGALIADFRVNYSYATNATANGKFSIICYNGSLFGAVSNASVVDGGYHTFAGRRIGSAFAVFCDGRDVTASSTPSSASFFATDQYTALGDEAFTIDTGGGSETFGAPLTIVCGWRRGLTNAEISGWCAEPFQFLIFPEDVVAAQLVPAAINLASGVGQTIMPTIWWSGSA
jgi:hypothetical protein